MHKYSPTLGSLIEMEVRSGFFADVTYGKVKVESQPLYHGFALYLEVYRHLGMEHVAWYFFRPLGNGDMVIVGISSNEAPLEAKALHRFERFYAEFEDELVALSP